jgi:hypothetical protein
VCSHECTRGLAFTDARPGCGICSTCCRGWLGSGGAFARGVPATYIWEFKRRTEGTLSDMAPALLVSK